MLITYLLDELTLSGPIITLDGTQIRDAISREILFEQAMSLEDIAFSWSAAFLFIWFIHIRSNQLF